MTSTYGSTPGRRLKISRDLFVELSKKSGVFSEKAMQFQERIMEKSGLGDETYLPPGEAHGWHKRTESGQHVV
jgi:FAE1/Type III polyketide synthase-like protein